MSIMQKIFGTTQAPSPVVATQTTPGNIPTSAGVVTTLSNPTTSESTPEATVSPLDQYKNMWETDPNAKPAVKEELFAGVTQEALQASAKKNDFSKVVTPEMMAAIAAGGEGANSAFLQAMNAMSQKGFGDSAFATTKIVEQALEKQQAKFEAMLPGLIKNQTVSENLRNTNPIFNHPAAAPILEGIKNQVIQKFPNATAAEQQKMAVDYLSKFAEAAQSPTKQTSEKRGNSEVDWSEFF